LLPSIFKVPCLGLAIFLRNSVAVAPPLIQDGSNVGFDEEDLLGAALKISKNIPILIHLEMLQYKCQVYYM